MIRAIKMKVMINGLPGKMASAAAEYLSTADDVEILPFSLTGLRNSERAHILGNLRIELLRPNQTGALKSMLDNYKSIIAVDYTRPDAVNGNAILYCTAGVPFIMGTTGGDRSLLEETIKNSGIVAVVAPNMDKQIVAFQDMMRYLSETYNWLFSGFALEIRESHQSTKIDTSGTARAMVRYFNSLGIPFTEEQIVMVRDQEEQLKLGVPEMALAGHAWHTYTLKSGDTSLFSFTHNINGRKGYAAGTLDALRFLEQRIASGEKGRVYSMMDVAKGL